MERAQHLRALSGWAVACGAALLAPHPAGANDGPVMVQGGSIEPVESDAVELVEEDVVIEAVEDPDLFPSFGSRVSVRYVLRNLRKKAVTVETGFPMTNCLYVGDTYVEDAMRFEAADGGKKIDVETITEGSEAASVCWALFDLAFAPSETKTLTMSYREPWLRGYDEAESQDYGFEELVYVLTPARRWAGKIGSATITLVYPAARKDPNDDARTLEVVPCNFSSTIEPSSWKAQKDEIRIEWSFESFEPSQELFVTHAPGACEGGSVRAVSPVGNYLRNAELQFENEGQLETIRSALTDALDLPANKLKKKRYAGYSGKKSQWSLRTLIERFFVPDGPFKSLGKDFYTDLKRPEVRTKIGLVLDSIASSASQ